MGRRLTVDCTKRTASWREDQWLTERKRQRHEEKTNGCSSLPKVEPLTRSGVHGRRLGELGQLDDADEVLALGGDEKDAFLLGYLADRGVLAAVGVLETAHDLPVFVQLHHDPEVGVVEDHLVVHQLKMT